MNLLYGHFCWDVCTHQAKLLGRFEAFLSPEGKKSWIFWIMITTWPRGSLITQFLWFVKTKTQEILIICHCSGQRLLVQIEDFQMQVTGEKSLSYLEELFSPRILEWVASPFSSRFSWPRNQVGVSCISSKFFTSWATRGAPVPCDVSFIQRSVCLKCLSLRLLLLLLSRFSCVWLCATP